MKHFSKFVPAFVLVSAVLSISAAAAADEYGSVQDECRSAALELFAAMNMEKTLETALDQTLEVQINSNPSLAPYRGVMKRFLAKYTSWAGLKDDFVRIYCEEFTPAEMLEMTAFYRTPVGAKAIEKTGILMKKGSDVGVKRVQDNMAELTTMVQEETARLNAGQQ